MTICRGLRVYTCFILFLVFIHSLIGSDFWVSPAKARYPGCPGGGPTPDPDQLVWLPYRSFCVGVQTMSSNPGSLLIDDYPQEDIPDCAAIKSVGPFSIREPWSRGSHRGCSAKTSYEASIRLAMRLSRGRDWPDPGSIVKMYRRCGKRGLKFQFRPPALNWTGRGLAGALLINIPTTRWRPPRNPY